MGDEKAPLVEKFLLQTALENTYREMIKAKPNDRSPKDRNMAVLITDFEKVLAWYSAYCQ